MLVESGILAVQLKQSGISLTMGIQNPNSTDKESSTWNPEYEVWNPESRLSWITLITMGRKKCVIQTPMLGITYTFTLPVRC